MLKQDVERRGAEVGYWLGQAQWGRGFMPLVLNTFISEHVWPSFPNVLRLEACVYATNKASARVLEKSGSHLLLFPLQTVHEKIEICVSPGFLKEGVLRSKYFKHGQVQVIISEEGARKCFACGVLVKYVNTNMYLAAPAVFM
jgi:hypothetical protein